MFSGFGSRRVLVGAVVLIGVAQAASGGSISRLRARQSQQQQQQQQQHHHHHHHHHQYQQTAQNYNGDGSMFETGGGSLEFEHGRRLSNGGDSGGPVPIPERFGQAQLGRSLLSTRNPQCNLPEVNPCTLNTTAIGMVESGFATFYDDTCEATGAEGCYTEGTAACRTCYLSTEVYLEANPNATAQSIPNWVLCPCCVPTTLQSDHVDIEVKGFDFSIFNTSEVDCTDSPTPAPALADAVTTTPTPAAKPVQPTPAPEAASRALSSPAPLEAPTPAPTVAASSTSTDGASGVEPGNVNLDTTSDGDEGLSMGEKVGIGAGAAVGVILLGITAFGVVKARGRS